MTSRRYFHWIGAILLVSYPPVMVSSFVTPRPKSTQSGTGIRYTPSRSRLFVEEPSGFSANEASANEGTTTTTTTSANHNMDPYIEIQYESYFDGTKPDSSWKLAWNNFVRQGASLGQQGLEQIGILPKDELRPPGCLGLRLSNEAVTETEDRRIAAGGGVDAHPVSQALYDVGCLLLDRLFDDRPIQRFWFLETIARIPYFSYVSMLHLYESFGWFRAVELRKVHAAEDWNELHHLLIMESLGGNSQWTDRFLGYHVAFAYYWFLVAVYLGSPRIAYQFMELLEAHAVDTYTTFVRENRERLRELPAPTVASSYYKFGDLYLFDDFMTTREPGTRRPPCDTLLDVFENIAIDEGEHVKTMKACQDYAQFGTKVVSSHLKYKIGPNGQPQIRETGDEETDELAVAEYKRQKWKEWSDSINEQIDNELEGMDRGSELDL